MASNTKERPIRCSVEAEQAAREPQHTHLCAWMRNPVTKLCDQRLLVLWFVVFHILVGNSAAGEVKKQTC